MLPLLVTALATCPDGAVQKERATPEAREQWCEDATGRRHGPRRAWYRSGKPWFEGEYRDGKRVGAWRFWYEGGGPMSAARYDDDRADGPFTRWHETGAKSMEGTCRAGKAHGQWTRWWPNGKPEVEVVFDDGRPGVARYTSRRGTPVPFADWVRDRAPGVEPGKARDPYALERLFAECAD